MITRKTYNNIIIFLPLFILSILCSIISNYILFIGYFFLICLLFIKVHNVKTIYFFTLCTLCQNIYLIFFSQSLNPSESQLIIIVKELVIYICAFLFYLKYRLIGKNSKKLNNILFVILFAILFVNVLRPGTSFNDKITALRQICIAPLCFYFGYYINIKYFGLKKFLVKYILIIKILCITGLFIYILPDDFWTLLNYDIYIFNKKGITGSDVFTSFYSYDLGFKLKRFVSFTADPLATSHILGMIMIYILLCFRKRYFKSFLIIFICGLLCISKSLIFLFSIFFFTYTYLKINNKKKRYIFLSFTILLFIGLFFYAIQHFNSLEIKTAAGNHFASLLYGLNNNSFLGNGLGTAGYNVIVSGAENVDDGYTESFFAVLIAQIGIIGALCFYLFLYTIIMSLIKLYRDTNNSIVMSSSIILVYITLESFISASAITMLGTSLYFIIPGIILRNKKEFIGVQ